MNIEQKEKERQERIAQGKALFEAKKPAWSKALIIGMKHIDKCDSMSDYFAVNDTEHIILAWSKHTRDLFPELRKAALNAEETKHLFDAPQKAEHREKYAMGAGFYLKAEGTYSTGWAVEKWDIAGYRIDQIYEIMGIPGRFRIPENNEKVETKITTKKTEQEANSKKRQAEISEYKGHPVISLPLNGEYNFTFGVAKAKTILEYLEDIKKFVAANE